MLRRFYVHVQPTLFLHNGRDELCVAFNYRGPGAMQRALRQVHCVKLELNDTATFTHAPRHLDPMVGMSKAIADVLAMALLLPTEVSQRRPKRQHKTAHRLKHAANNDSKKHYRNRALILFSSVRVAFYHLSSASPSSVVLPPLRFTIYLSFLPFVRVTTSSRRGGRYSSSHQRIFPSVIHPPSPVYNYQITLPFSRMSGGSAWTVRGGQRRQRTSQQTRRVKYLTQPSGQEEFAGQMV
ncbi:hypothetical protein C8J57DRAFT_1360519 [Mycena rebaudengoi]|nr:hypothetical protein C8J57DRAFT_1360519 [Mycena rebaudengoi]